jgi:hypothetical protein
MRQQGHNLKAFLILVALGWTLPSGAATPPTPQGDFPSVRIDAAVPSWWWAVVAGVAVAGALPMVPKSRWTYASFLSLSLCLLSLLGWKRSFRGQESVGILTWNDGERGSLFQTELWLNTGAGGIGMRYVGFRRLPTAGSEIMEEARRSPRHVFRWVRGSSIFYPGFNPRRSSGFLPVRGVNRFQFAWLDQEPNPSLE